MNQAQPSSLATCSSAGDVPQEPLIDLRSWLTNTYNPSDAPCVNTVRRWVREKRIKPQPEKQGRAYYFHPRAKYVQPAGDGR